ncbi:SDR family NAD(P)-dependent oxidoreductase [Streptomyces sparsogenes]|uniref:SDR family NAD(P)-dependent oxidoreductase n=1 Tax=Streptomyces sparsogenes TaxID=67365 RepID=UPI0033E88876
MATEDQLVEYLKRVTTELQDTRRRLRQAEEQVHEPVAVVAMACRFPGADSPEALWDLVAAGADATGDFPTNRGWDLEGLFHPDPDHPGTCYTRRGGFLYDADRFDAAFFGISPREAMASSPQQRLLLECAWEAIERAGIDPVSLHGTRTGVYAGTATTGDGSKGGASQASEGYAGNAPSLLSGRVSYTLGLEGPAVTIETACSSSLVAIHLAAQALRQGECSLALAGGVTVMATPEVFTGFSRQRGLSPDGRCKAFAASADGTGWGEGVGLVLLEKLSDARRKGHRVLAVVRGSAINQDGASNGFTAPNGPSQQRVIQQALAGARLSASEVDAVETHGTGTVLGDSIEADALIAAYGRNRPEGRPVLLGSIKSNIGHTQGAAGVAGVIKMIMAMRHGLLPASLHIDEPTPHVEWDDTAVRLLTGAQEWPRTGHPRRAGVSSFGISGTNAHVILEQAPAAGEETPAGADDTTPVDDTTAADDTTHAGATGPLPWVISARSRQALRSRARDLADRLALDPDDTAVDVGWSLATTRSVFEHRAVAVGAGRDELLAAVEALADESAHPALVGPAGTVGADAGPVLVFPGQGSQWVGMGVELLESSSVFAGRIAGCEQALKPYVDWSLTEVLRGDGSELARVDVVQPVLWAVMVSLAAVWAEHGVVPAAVIGHSQGEIAAACVAGALSLEDGARVVALRSRALRALSGGGAMASLGVGATEAEGHFPAGGGVVVAAVNGPSSTVVSGPPEAVAQVVEAVQAAGHRARLIDVDYASHGPQVDEITGELHRVLAGVRPVASQVAFYSTVTASRIDTAALDTGYWVRNLRERVRFADTVRALLEDGHRIFVEASPHPVLTLGLQETFEEADTAATVIPTLRRDQGGPGQVVRVVGEAFTVGARVDWRACFPAGGARVVDLPTYPFQRRRYWEESATRPGQDPAGLGLTPAEHPLLGAMLEVAEADTRVLTGRLSATGPDWLADHRLDGTVLVPGAALVEWALRAADEAGCGGVEELTLRTPLVLPPSGHVRVQVVVGTADRDGRREIRVHSRPDHGTQEPAAGTEWVCHASGTLTAVADAPDQALTGAWPPPDAQPVGLDGFYERAAAAGYEYGPAFQGLTAAWRHGDDLLAEVRLPEAVGDQATGFGIHPALLDAVLHPALLGERPAGGDGAGSVWLPFAWNGVALRATGATTVRVRVSPQDGAAPGGGRALRLHVADTAGAPVLDAASVHLRPADTRSLRAAARAGARGLFTLEWTPLPAAGARDEAANGPWVQLGPPLPPSGRTAAAHHADLAALVAALDAGECAPATVLTGVPSPTAVPSAEGAAGDGLAAAQEALRLVQGWLAEPRLAGTRLVFVTRGAVTTTDPGEQDATPDPGEQSATPDPGEQGATPDPGEQGATTGPGEQGAAAVDAAAAAVWGLVRAAQAEHPDQFVLLDLDPALQEQETDGGPGPAEAAALAVGAGEPQAAVRAGRVLVPRLARVAARQATDPGTLGTPGTPGALDPDGTVLITGGTGTLGGHVAEHLVRTWGVRYLLLAGRRGPTAPGAAELAERLTALGAEVRTVAADAADPEAVAQLLGGIDPAHPLTGVIHAAGTLDDAVVTAQSDARLARVWQAKATAALNLHQATTGLPLGLFVTFSSAAGVIGNVGQAGYAAANAYVDALVARRRAAGLPGVSIAWGLWEQTSGLTGHLSDADLARLHRSGLVPLPTGQALDLLDAACHPGHSLVVAAGIDVRGLPAADLPTMLRGLTGRAGRPTAAGALGTDPAQATELARRLAGLDAAGRLAAATDLVRGCVAVVLGHDSPAEVRTDMPFKDLGFESVTAVELRNRLSAHCGLRLPATLAFDHPTPDALAAYLCTRLTGETAAPTAPAPAATDEPVAIVAMACRYPGGVRSPEDLWELVTRGVDAMGAFPEDRGWDLDRLFHPDPDHPGTSYADQGAFLYDADGFDAEFFGISPREALAMDPQQRLLLETSWELLERAGISPAALKGSRTGMYAGVMYHDYATGLATSGDAKLEGYAMLAGSGSAATGRVSYTLGLEGPAVTVDTACSSSLVAMHLAAQALRQGECSLALAGGATVMATPEVFTGFSRQRGLAPDGRCKPFAAAADGTGWGEGVGLVLLERLSDARRNGHPVLAVLRGSAVNQDGASNGLTAPNGPSQERVIRQALAQAGLSPAEVDAVEAHGTGTKLGDPIEAGALLAAYGQERPAERPLWLGSVKSNIGHTQAAAGVAGVIKMVMALRHGVLPATLHIDEPSPHVDWDSGAVSLLTARMTWPETGRARRAGVSSFGASGTNAHLILEQGPEPADDPARRPEPEPTARPVPWAISARTAEALRAQATALTAHLRDIPATAERIGWSLATTRSAFDHRAVVLGTERDELLAGLAALAAGEPHPGLVCPGAPAATAGPGPVLVFPGQGSQWAGMGAELLDTSSAFADRIAACERALAPYVDWSLTDVLRGDGSELARVDVVQPVLWAVMVSLAAVWAEHGVIPAAVIGHSQGEIAAACVAGALALEDGAKIVALRSRALRRLAGRGAMASLQTGPEQAHALCDPHPGVTVAAVNGPGSVVISGPPEPVAAVVAEAMSRGLRARTIDVDYASHGPQIDEITDELGTLLAGVRPRTAPVAFYSTVTGERTDTAALDTGYWITNLRQQVRFADAVDALLAAGHRVFIEAGPHPVLTLGVQECFERAGVSAAAVPTLRRDAGGLTQLGHALAQAFTAGTPVDWAAWLPAHPALELPTYPFQHRRYWLDARPGGPQDPGGLGLEAARHPVLAAATQLAGTGTHLLTGRLTHRGQPWLTDHRVLDTTLVPGAALVEWALRAADEAGRGRVEELTLREPLVLPDTGGARVQVQVGAADHDGRCEISIHARPDADGDPGEPARPWTCHATGTLVPAAQAPAPETAPDPAAAWPPPGARALDLADFYDRVAAAGYAYGPGFQGLRAVWRDGNDLLAEAELPQAAGEPAGYGVHPALLDAALQTALLLGADDGSGTDGVWLPFAWNGVSLWATGATTVRVRITPQAVERDAANAADGEREVRVTVADAVGAPVLTADSVVLRAADPARLRTTRDDATDGLFTVEWTPLSVPDATAHHDTPNDTPWAILGPDAAEPGPGTAEPGPGTDGHATGANTGTDEHAAPNTGTDGGRAAPLPAGHPDLSSLIAALDGGAPVPPLVLAPLAPDGTDALDAATEALTLVRGWLAEPRLAASRLVLVTRGAVTADDADREPDPAGAAVWGLVRSAQSEEPDRLVLLDLGRGDDPGRPATLAAARHLAAAGEPQAALRDGRLLAPRLVRAPGPGAPAAALPGRTGTWRLESGPKATWEDVLPVPSPEAEAPLEPGQVRIHVRAAGVNFRDALVSLGMAPGQTGLGSEGAGVVTEVGPEVTGFAPGDRVMGLFAGAFGPEAVADARMLTAMPPGWDFTTAAAVPVVFATAWFGLADLARVRAGETVLVHAATGGVGTAAVQIARHLGAEVFATAGPGKQHVLEAMGIDAAHRASSRDLDFEDAFRRATGGRGVDVVLNSLTGEFIDASLRLLADGGRFLEMGKTDHRDPGEVAVRHPGVTYRIYDLIPDGGPVRIGEILAELAGLFTAGTLRPAPVRAWPLARAREALRWLGRARHIGKVVLETPPPIDPDGTVLITGGTGTLGGHLAEHLAATWGVRHLLLVSRRGPDAPGAAELADRLAALGARARLVAADVTDPAAVDRLLAEVPAGHPLTGVVHAAGALDDGVIAAQTPERLARVWAVKAAAAHHLHDATAGLPLGLFVLFSSSAATLGSPGQANYAAANAYCEALAARRQAAGLPAVSIGWGLWGEASGMTGQLTDTDLARMARTGIGALTTERGLELFDTSCRHGSPHLLAVDLDTRALAARPATALPPLFRALTGAATARRTAAAGTGPGVPDWAGRLAGLTGEEQHRALLDLVRTHAAAVLGHAGSEAIHADTPFKDLGFDSLTAVELRNKLTAATGLHLPATFVFRHPTPSAVAAYLHGELAPAEADPAEPALAELARLEDAVGRIAEGDDEIRGRLVKRLESLVWRLGDHAAEDEDAVDGDALDTASDDELFALIDREVPS